MANLKKLPLGDNAPDEINVVIEIPKGTHTKIEYDPILEVFKLAHSKSIV